MATRILKITLLHRSFFTILFHLFILLKPIIFGQLSTPISCIMLPLRTCYFVLLTASVCLSACSKASEPTPRTRTELLTAPNWRLTQSVEVLTYNGTTTTTDKMLLMDPCEKDDFIKFTTTPSRSFTIDQGSLICVSPTASGYKGVWAFGTNETVLLYNPGTSYQAEEQIQTLTDTKLVLLYEGRVVTGSNTYVPYYRTNTYTAF